MLGVVLPPFGCRDDDAAAESDPRLLPAAGLVGVRVELLRTVAKEAVDWRRDAIGETEAERKGSAAAVVDTEGRRRKEEGEPGAVPRAVIEMLPPPVDRYERTVSVLVWL